MGQVFNLPDPTSLGEIRQVEKPAPQVCGVTYAFAAEVLPGSGFHLASACLEPLNMPVNDPWSRPTLSDLHRILESVGKQDGANQREAERLELTVPAEITTPRGNVIAAMTREISRLGIGLLHRGSVSPGEVTLRMASETRDFEYRVLIEWCAPCDNGMFMSGGRFLRKNA